MTSEGRERDSIHRPDEATPVSHDAPTIPSGVVERAAEAARVVREEMAGDSYGDYERREVLGEGGFGIVYACEQLRPIRRRVALKVLKLGMDSREILGRFEAERQTLAMMDHPSVAKVLDAGISEKGRPYFVMEYVKGVPITQYCDENRVGTAGRLELFVKVCQAVQHAHTKGIIHRDIKPSNVLVTLVDDKPVPKVIDFGIAKAMAGGASMRSEVTEAGRLVGTPEYMSPEQAGMSPLDVDARSDVYALGVLLYELLTGMLPLDVGRLRRAGFAEIQRLIREEDPPKPSTRLGRTSVIEAGNGGGIGPETVRALAEIARHRRTNPASLVRELRGELDWITMKALEKDRTRRYETAAALAEDIRHYLSDEPVSAGPPSALYKARKFARRHRGLVWGGGIGVAATVVGVVVLSAAYREAEGQREAAIRERDRADREMTVAQAAQRKSELEKKRADREASKSKAALMFVFDMFASIDPNASKGKEVTVREMLDAASKKVGDSLAKEYVAQASVRQILGETYYKLDQIDQSEKQIRRAIELMNEAGATDDPELYQYQHNLGAVLLSQGRADEAEVVLKLAEKGRLEKFGEANRDTLATQSLLATLLQSKNDWAGAEAAIRRLAERQTLALGAKDRDTIDTRAGLANVLHMNGKLEEAEVVSRALVADSVSALGADDTYTLQARSIHGAILEEMGRYADAEAVLRDVVASKVRVLGANHTGTLISENSLAIALEAQKKYGEAEAMLRSILERAETHLGPEHPQTLSSTNNLAQYLRNQKKYAEAEPLYRRAMAMDLRVHGEQSRQYFTAEVNLGLLLVETGRAAEALPMFEHAVKGIDAMLGKEHWMAGAGRTFLGECLAAMERYEDAERVLTESVTMLEASVGAASDRTKMAASKFVKLYEAWGKPDEAAKWRDRAK